MIYQGSKFIFYRTSVNTIWITLFLNFTHKKYIKRLHSCSSNPLFFYLLFTFYELFAFAKKYKKKWFHIKIKWSTVNPRRLPQVGPIPTLGLELKSIEKYPFWDPNFFFPPGVIGDGLRYTRILKKFYRYPILILASLSLT